MKTNLVSSSPDETFRAGEDLGRGLAAGDLILLTGGLGAGKTLFTKGILNALEFDADEVTSPSFTLVNLYETDRYNVYHVDLWRLDETAKPAEAVGLEEILENPNAITVIEWADRLGRFSAFNNTIRVTIEGNGEEPRRIEIAGTERPAVKS
jgi:tRNA threonylcarbamoyladenosine biosynthesis protein TsaE